MDLRAALIICQLILWTRDLSYIAFTSWTFTKCDTVDGNKIFLSGSCSLSILTRSITNWELSLSSRRDTRKRLSFMWHRWAWSKAWQVLQGREARSRKTKPCIQTKEITLVIFVPLEDTVLLPVMNSIVRSGPFLFSFFTRLNHQPSQKILRKHFYFLPEHGKVSCSLSSWHQWIFLFLDVRFLWKMTMMAYL